MSDQPTMVVEVPADLYLEDGRVNPARLAEILYRNTVVLESLGPAARDALAHKAQCDDAKTRLFNAMAQAVSSPIAKFLVALVLISFTLACLRWAGLPVDEALGLIGSSTAGG